MEGKGTLQVMRMKGASRHYANVLLVGYASGKGKSFTHPTTTPVMTTNMYYVKETDPVALRSTPGLVWCLVNRLTLYSRCYSSEGWTPERQCVDSGSSPE
jgi:hypothetical protein